MKTLYIANTRCGGIVSEFGTFIPWIYVKEWIEFMEQKTDRKKISFYKLKKDYVPTKTIQRIWQFEVDMILSDGPRFQVPVTEFDKVSWMPIRFTLGIKKEQLPRDSWLARMQGDLHFSGQIIHWLRKKPAII